MIFSDCCKYTSAFLLFHIVDLISFMALIVFEYRVSPASKGKFERAIGVREKRGSCAVLRALCRSLLVVESRKGILVGVVILVILWRHLFIFFNALCSSVAFRDSA